MDGRDRREEAGGVYHWWARGARKAVIFQDDDDREMYLSLVARVVREHRWKILAYCLMDNHVHFLVELTRPNMGAGVKSLHNAYARYFNERHQPGAGHLFGARFGSSRADDAMTVAHFASYVLLNPVRANRCQQPERYAWSSCAASINDTPRPVWLDVQRLDAHLAKQGSALSDVLRAMCAIGAGAIDPPIPRALRERYGA